MNQLNEHRLAGLALRVGIPLVIGLAVAGTGWGLADRASRDMASVIAKASRDRATLAQSMVDGEIDTAATRLGELAGLPLLSEYLDLAVIQPDSVDAAELKAYLADVLGASAKELGAADLVAMTQAGEVLVATRYKSEATPPSQSTSTGAVLVSTPSGEPQLWLRQSVPSLEDPMQPAGALLMRFAPETFGGLGTLGLTLRIAGTHSGQQSATAATQATPVSPVVEVVVSETPAPSDFLGLRLFALLSGFFAVIASAWLLPSARRAAAPAE